MKMSLIARNQAHTQDLIRNVVGRAQPTQQIIMKKRKKKEMRK